MRLDKVLSIFGFLSLFGALFIIGVTPPPSGYEISIYAVYPVYFWGFLIICFVLGTILLVRRIFTKNLSSYWIAGIVIILAANSIVLLLPVFRGYVYYGVTDPAQHFGYIKDVYLYGHFQAPYTRFENFYPAFHVFTASLSLITGADLKLLTMLTPWLFFLFYVLSIFILARVLTADFRQSLLITAFGSPLSFIWLQSAPIPTILLFFYTPFIMALIYLRESRLNKVSYTFALLLCLFFVPFAHAGDTVVIIFLLVCFELSRKLYSRWQTKRSTSPVLKEAPLSLVSPSLILSITWFVWFASFATFAKTTKAVFNWLVYGTGLSEGLIFIGILERAHASIFDFLEVFLATHAHNLLYFSISFVIVLNIVRKLAKGQEVGTTYIILSLLFVILVVLTPLFTSMPGAGSFRRTLPYAIFVATILNGLGLYDWFNKTNMKNLVIFLVTTVLLATMILGVFTVFRSPFIKSANEQVTEMDFQGGKWLLNHNNEKNLIDQIRVRQYALCAIILGNEKAPQNIRWGTSDTYQAPDHFGYKTREMYGQVYKQDRYFVSNKLDRILLPMVFPEFKPYWRWNEDDWAKLEQDWSVQRIYYNGEFEIFYVRACR